MTMAAKVNKRMLTKDVPVWITTLSTDTSIFRALFNSVDRSSGSLTPTRHECDRDNGSPSLPA